MIRMLLACALGFVAGYLTGVHAVIMIEREVEPDRYMHESGDTY